jgi:hypothetical protein
VTQSTPYCCVKRYKRLTNEYILEVQVETQAGVYEHAGYLNIVFKSKHSAEEYYNKSHPGLRKIKNDRSDLVSEVGDDNMRYVVRRYHGETLKIDDTHP